MKNLKKVLALVVALTMVFTTVAFASYPDVDANADYAGAVELLSALDILKGDDAGNFNPDNTITRAEFAAVVCRALGLEGSANGAKGATMFTDVAADHWASGYVNLASQQGIVNGKGNGIFDPEGNVTFTEAVKMLVVALGYEPMAAQRGGWPTGYLTVANSTKMTAGVSASGTDAAALRSTVAQLTANAIEIPVMDQTSFGTETKYEPMDDYGNYKTLLTSRDVYIATGVITNVDEVDGEFDFKFSAYPDDFEFGYNSNGYADASFIGSTKTFDVAASNVADYIGQNVDVYLSKVNRSDYEALIAVPTGIGATLTIGVDDLYGSAAISTAANKTTTLEYYETSDATKTTKLYVAGNPVVKVNGVVVNDGASTVAVTDLLDSAYTQRNTQLTFVENTNDKYYDIIDITIYDYAIIDEVLVDNGRIEFADGSKVVFDFDDDQQISKFYTAEGAEIAFEDLVAGDVVAMVVGEVNGIVPVKYNTFKEKITIYSLGQSTVTGSVSGWDAGDPNNNVNPVLYIDGAEYECSPLTWVTDDKYSDLIATGDPLGTDGLFYLGMDGKVIGYDGSQSVSANYGFIIDAYKNTSSFEPQYQIKLLTTEGILVYNVDEKCEITFVDTNDSNKVKTVTAKVDVQGEPDQSTYFPVNSKYSNSNASETVVMGRLVDFDLNKDGEIDEIAFVSAKSNVKVHDIITNGDVEFKASTTKLGSRALEQNLVIFNVKTPDIDDATALDLSYLVDEGTYGGIAVDINNDKEVDIFVMTSGTSPFTADGHVFVVDSKVTTTYGDDSVDAVQVTYYTEGVNEPLTAIFTEDSENIVNVGTDEFKGLAKGSVFVANVAADGLVTEYAVIANIANKAYNLVGDLKSTTQAIYGTNEVDKKDDKVEFVYGYLTDINGKTLTLGGKFDANATVSSDVTEGREFTIDASVAQYTYNVDGQKAKINVGDYAGSQNVDDYDLTKKTANLVLLKVYDGDVIDIITISDRVANVVPGILAQTHWDANTTPNLKSVEEKTEVVDVVEDIVVEDVIDFE